MTLQNIPRDISQPTTHVLYLHGFRSSPRSTKAQQMAKVMAAQYPHITWWCPQLPPSPQAAVALIHQGTADWPAHSMAVMGSSLGGFYATWVAAQRSCKAVLLNPAIDPARDLATYIGEQTAWHDPAERFYFAPEFVDELRALEVGPLPHPERVWALIAKGDEVLDWREMTARYPGSQQVVMEGGDHAISDFESYLPQVLAFLDLQPGV
ncbi:YqiA/YcfP family alpha/beta fold hydrolase [Limnohabitans sp. INBF002]|uniref:YqiA/YcfP family alpha/beta fold hydrolase n=1 Tax=Limnohabitans sp. INBF002 TaxID=2986280 RepID=UPI002377C7F1|nr:YqiA/YcfP family alpha/beta fold hydrolase [Limnohabitans sp. INBF002]BDU52166.1 esterase [Limnohabitans sp. INBF002]